MRTPRKMLCGAMLSVLLFAQLCKAQYPTGRPGPPDERLRLAGSLARDGKIEEAVEQYKSYYADNPEQHIVLESIARLYERSGRTAEAIEFLEKYLLTGASSPGGYSQFEDQCYRLLRLWEEAGGIQAAQDYYLSLTEDENTTAAKLILAQVMVGRIKEQMRDAVGALDNHLATLELISPADDGLRKTVNSLLLHKFIGKNLLDYAVAAYRNCPDPTQLIELGDRLRRDGRGFEMLNLYEDYLLSPTPEFIADAHQWHDFSRYRHNSLAAKVIDELVSLGQADTLLEQLKAATVQQTAGAELYRNLAYLLLKMKRHEEAIGEFENYLAAVERPLATDYEWVACLCKDAGLIDHAIRFYEFARDTGFTDEEIRRESMMFQMAAPMGNWKARFKARILQPLGNLYMAKNRWTDAEACFKEIVDSSGGRDAEHAKGSLARVWEKLGKENVFIEELKAEVAAEPCNVELTTRHAETLLRAGKKREAIEQYQRAVELSPEDLSARLKLADALARDRQNEKAIEEYLKVLRAGLKKDKSEFRRSKGGDPTEPWQVLNVLARFCKRSGQSDRLLEIHQEVLSLLDSPETKWKPQPYVVERILRDMTDILETKGEHALIVELWLDYRNQTTARGRYAIEDRLRYFDSLKDLIAELQKETKADPNDFWGRFILGDMLLTEQREDEAVQVYTSLLNDVPEPHRIHHDLGQLFERRLKRHDLALQAYQRALSQVEPGTRDYAHRLSLVARTHVKLGNKEKAAELYRQAISLDPANADYRRELSKATGSEEEASDVTELQIGPAEDLSVKRQQAYRALGRTEEAVALFEKALGMRAWSHGSDYGAAGELQHFYRQTNKEDKLIALLTDRQDYTAIKGYYDQQKQPEKFKQYLIDQIKRKPAPQLRFCLGEYHLDGKDIAAAAQIYEQLYAELAAEDGKISNKRYALKLAEAFANLGNVKNASRILVGVDYENDRDRNDRTGSVLMRTYAKIGQFDKALEVCALRLKRDPDGHRTLNIAEQVAEGSRACANGPALLDLFLEQVKEDITQRQYQRFRGAVKAYLAAHPAERDTEHVTTDALALLRDGRRVEVPKGCRSFANFLEKLAFPAGTVATQSFMHEYGRSRKAPQLKAKSGSAFEILAEVLDGDNIPMEMTQDGYWAFYESGDKNKKYIYAGCGGMFCKLQPFNRLPDGKNIYALGQVFFEPAVQQRVASIQSLFNVVEAIDGTGRKMTPPQARERWDYSTQIEIMLGKPSLFTRNIKRLRVKTAVALCTKWATFNVNRLDHSQPIVMEKDNVRIQIDPIGVSRLGKPCWEMPIDIKAKNVKLKSGGDFQVELKDELRFFDKNGGELRPDCYRTSPSGGQTKITARTDINAFDPATVSLFIKQPAAIEIVPFELTFHNIPIIKR